MKKIISILLCLCIFASLTVAFGAQVTDFTDIKPADWFYADVEYVVSHGMFNGMSAAQFGPLNSMTRGMFVTVLGRYANASGTVPSESESSVTQGRVAFTDVNMRANPTTAGSSTVLATLRKNTLVEILDKVDSADGTSYKWYQVRYSNTVGYIREDLLTPIATGGPLSDVRSDSYYAPYVYWALEKGIAAKTGDNTFSPESPITREDICYMLYNYAAFKHLQLTATVNPAPFSDAGSISSSCKDAVTALQRCGIINGYPDGTFLPKNGASRAEVSAFIVRFLNCIAYKPDTDPSLDANGNYIWGSAVPEGITMNSSYLNDACFIGHSIVVGMETYFGLAQTDFFALNSANTRSILTYTGFPLKNPRIDDNGKTRDTGTLEEALSDKSYGKVYIMLGTNEVGGAEYHRNTFATNMSAIVDLVRQLQPNAKIYLFSLTPVSQSCSETREDLTRDNIVAFNKEIKKICASKRCYYLNVFDLLVNSDGYLPDDAGMSDGIHILRPAYISMKSYVLNHAV